jgi:hypothetical protein
MTSNTIGCESRIGRDNKMEQHLERMVGLQNSLVSTNIMLESILTELRGAVPENRPSSEVKTMDYPPLMERLVNADLTLEALADSLCAYANELQEYI